MGRFRALMRFRGQMTYCLSNSKSGVKLSRWLGETSDVRGPLRTPCIFIFFFVYSIALYTNIRDEIQSLILL